MKHTIKLLTLDFTLAAILTLTGCPGPVNTVVPCTHENKKTVIETAATCTETGLEKIICADCEKVIDEQATISRFVAGGYDGDIPAEIENPETYHYQYNKEDDYQIMAYVYSSVEDAKKGENETVLYFSFPNDTTGIPQIVTINAGLAINLDDLIQMKNKYIGNTVKYVGFEQNDFSIQIDTCKYMKDPYSLTDLENNGRQIYIVIE